MVSNNYPITHKLLIDYLDYAESAIDHNIKPLLFTGEALKRLVTAHLELLKLAKELTEECEADWDMHVWDIRQIVESYYPEGEDE